MSTKFLDRDRREGDRFDRFYGWSVVVVGVLLGVISVLGGGVDSSGTTGGQILVPLVASAAIVAAGIRLRRGGLRPDDTAVVAIWIAGTAAIFGIVVMTAAFVLASEPLPTGGYIAAFMAPVGAIGGAVAGYSDVRRRTQHRTVQRTQRALEAATDGIAIMDDDGEYVTVNRAHADVYGYDDPEEMVGKRWTMCYTEREADRIEAEIAEFEERGEWRGEAIGRRKDGSTFPQELTVTRMDGGFVCIVRDITERRKQEQLLGSQKRRLRTIIENIPIVLFAFDEDGTITLSEGKSLETLGLEAGELVGESIFEIYAEVPDVLEGARQALGGETVHRTLEFDDVVFETWMTPLYEDGEVIRVIGTAMDVTKQHEQERQIAAIHDASRRLTYATTLDEVAETAVEIAGEILDRPLSALWSYDENTEQLQPIRINDTMAALLDDSDISSYAVGEGSVGMECFREGEIRVIDDYSSFERAAFPSAGLGTLVLVPLGDHGLLQVGHRKQTGISDTEWTQLEILQMNIEAALDRAEHESLLRQRTDELEIRTSQMEFINSILRHDVLNGMTVIRARAELLEEELEGRQSEYSETIVRWCDDISNFIERVQTVLDALSDEEDLALKPVNATVLLREEIEQLRQTYPDVSFVATIPEKTPVWADELLGDVLGNLARNAVEHNDSEDLTVTVSVDPGEDLTTIRVADNGRGIPTEERDAVFRRGETHAKSTGSGFGLFFVDAMIDAYDGKIRIEDNDPGAVFVIELQSVEPDTPTKELE